MRFWGQVFSSRERNPNFHEALEQHLRAVVEPGVEIELHGTHKGGLGEQFRFFQAIDTPDIIQNVLTCKNAKDANGHRRYDAFVSLNSTDPALVEAREILDIPVTEFLETAAHLSCMMGKTFSLIAPNPKFALSFEQKLKLYGWTERLSSIEAMNIPNLADFRQGFIDPAAHQRILTEFDQAARRAVAKGAEVLILCGSHAVLQARRGLREIDGALIVDGLAMLMKMTEAAVKLQQIMGTVVSRKMLYQTPGPDVLEKAQKDYGLEL